MNFHSSLIIEGAIKVSEDHDEEVSTWQWNMVKPTELRMYPQYAEVGSFQGTLESTQLSLHEECSESQNYKDFQIAYC